VVANGILYAVADDDRVNHTLHISAFSLNGKPPYSEKIPAAPSPANCARIIRCA
jgi:hypothetical protein